MVPKELIDFLKKEDTFLIATHFSPDGDALGSAIALSMALRQIGKKTVLLDKDPVPHAYSFLPGCKEFITIEKFAGHGLTDFVNLVLVDCNDLDRVSSNKSQISSLKFQTSAVIDHHASAKPFGDIKWVRPETAATGMMVFHIIKELGVKITSDMAINLYTAIAVDTGNFRHENTTPDALRIAAELAEAGARPNEISRELFDSWSEGRFRLFIEVLNTLEIIDNIAMMTITRKMFEETSTASDDTETFVEYPRLIKNIGISVLLREIDDNSYKISLRSKGHLNVAHVAEAFNGGGHKNAAGCSIKADLETAKTEVLKKIRSNTAR